MTETADVKDGTGEGEDFGQVAYETWQRERGIPGDGHWDMMPPAAQSAWRATAQAVLTAAGSSAATAALLSLAAEFEAEAAKCASAFPGSAATFMSAASLARSRARAVATEPATVSPVPGDSSDGGEAHKSARRGWDGSW